MKQRPFSVVIASLGFIILILDTKTALSGAAEGIDLCMRTVIPSLFPFIFLSIMLTSAISGWHIPILKPLSRFVHIPVGTEALLLVGCLGGYPVGAQCIAEAVRKEGISRETGRRMLSFCSNAGPAFLFGIGSTLFSQPWKCWVLWAIHIGSALLIGHFTPSVTDHVTYTMKSTKTTASRTLQQTLRVMATICGWVVLFRVVFVFCKRWFLWRLPMTAQSIFAGLLELTNGCCILALIANEDIRFILCSLFLGFGGICVMMQTYSVCDGMDTSRYLPGKILHAFLSTFLATAVISREMACFLFPILIIFICAHYYFTKKRKKAIAFFPAILYNGGKANRR